MVSTPAGHISVATAEGQLISLCQRKEILAWSLQLHKRSKITLWRPPFNSPGHIPALELSVEAKDNVKRHFFQLPNQSCSDGIKRHIVGRITVGGGYSLGEI